MVLNMFLMSRKIKINGACRLNSTENFEKKYLKIRPNLFLSLDIKKIIRLLSRVTQFYRISKGGIIVKITNI